MRQGCTGSTSQGIVLLVCHCFRYSLETLQRGDEAEREAILGSIIAGMRQGQCACELHTPQGSGYLSNVRRLLRVGKTTADNHLEEQA